ncbi:MAG: hypothetical protein AB1941_22685 [Gemmatimonadota bacterium]
MKTVRTPPRAAPLLAALALALAAGCSPRPADEVPGQAAPPATPAPAATAPRAAELELTLEVPDTAAQGGPMPFRLVLANRGAAPAELVMSAPVPHMDVVVARPDGERVWSFLAGRGIPEGGQARTLAPGDSLELTRNALASWDGRESAPPRRPAPAGTYRVTGELHVQVAGAERVLRTEPRTLVLAPRRNE